MNGLLSQVDINQHLSSWGDSQILDHFKLTIAKDKIVQLFSALILTRGWFFFLEDTLYLSGRMA